MLISIHHAIGHTSVLMCKGLMAKRHMETMKLLMYIEIVSTTGETLSQTSWKACGSVWKNDFFFSQDEQHNNPKSIVSKSNEKARVSEMFIRKALRRLSRNSKKKNVWKFCRKKITSTRLTKLSVLDNKQVLSCIVFLYGNQQIDLNCYFN